MVALGAESDTKWLLREAGPQRSPSAEEEYFKTYTWIEERQRIKPSGLKQQS